MAISTKSPFFIGIDLSDPFARRKRPCTRATMGIDLNCGFDEWEYDLTGNQIIPYKILTLQFVLAIDGPQGLSGIPEATMRISERSLGTAGKSSFSFRPIGQPYAGYVQGSVKLFYSLTKTEHIQLYGLKNQKVCANLLEVYPGAAWPVIADYKLKNKKLLVGRQSRYELLMRAGMKFSADYTINNPPTHDQLDAAIAAYIAYLFAIGKATEHGQDPFEDELSCILREGFIIQPTHIF